MGPFEKPPAKDFDAVSDALERGARARQLFGLGVGSDLDRRRAAIWAQAENELRAGTITLERALMHVACSNALRRYHEELNDDITKAQSAADQLREASNPEDGENEPRPGE